MRMPFSGGDHRNAVSVRDGTADRRLDADAPNLLIHPGYASNDRSEDDGR
jgi:hypothetical protein